MAMAASTIAPSVNVLAGIGTSSRPVVRRKNTPAGRPDGGAEARAEARPSAVRRAAVPVCPLNYRLSAGQLAELIEQLDAPYVVVGREHAGLVPGRAVQVVDEWLAAASAAPALEAEPVADEAPAVILFTSGTTAAP